MSRNLLVRFDEGRVGARRCRLLSYSTIVFQPVDSSRDAVINRRHVEIDRQAKPLVGEPETGQELFLVNRGQQLDRFDFHNDLIFDHQMYQRMALPGMAGTTKSPASRSRHQDDAVDGGAPSRGHRLNGWRSPDIHQSILITFGLSATTYTLTQLRYDLRKMKSPGRTLARIGRSYGYGLTDKGVKAALMFISSTSGLWALGQLAVRSLARRNP